MDALLLVSRRPAAVKVALGDTKAERQTATGIAANVQGVREVVNNLQIRAQD